MEPILHRYLHFAKQYNAQYTSTVKAPADYSMYLDVSQPRTLLSKETDIQNSHNELQSSPNTTSNTPQQSLSNLSMRSINDVPSFNATFNNSLPATTNVTMQSINENDMSTPVRQFFRAARSSSTNELQLPMNARETIGLLPNPVVRIHDIGPVARNTRAKRRACHLDKTTPSPATRKKNRRAAHSISKQSGNGSVLKNWIC